MKNIVFILLVAVALTGCNSDEKKAAQLLHRAEQSFAAGDFNKAKMQIDSIKVAYPKAFDARRAGIKLMQQVDLKEQSKTLEYLDSMMNVKLKDLDAIKKNFVLEKDEEYQEIGNYFYPTQVVGKNIGRSYLRAQVSETGEMLLTSIYSGRNYIHHSCIKVSVGDTFAETSVSGDRYESKDLGRVLEKADYTVEKSGAVIGFVIANQDKKISIDYNGERKYHTTMQRNDVKAIVELSELSRVLSGIEQIKKEQKEAELKIRFVNRKIDEAANRELNKEEK